MRAPSSRTRRKVANRAELTGGLAASLERSPGCWREPSAQSTRSRGLNAGESEVLRQAFDRRVSDPRRGGRHTVRMIELIVEGLVLGAAKRDPRMVRLLLILLDRYAPSDAPKVDPEEVRAADREILDEFVASMTAALGKKEGTR